MNYESGNTEFVVGREGEDSTVRATNGCAIEVHRELGPGLPEHFYQRALCLELLARGTTSCRIAVQLNAAQLSIRRLVL